MAFNIMTCTRGLQANAFTGSFLRNFLPFLRALQLSLYPVSYGRVV
jgi:hypothetical protein